MKNTEIMAITNANLSPDTKLPIIVAWARRVNLKILSDARRLIDEAVNDLNKDFIDSGKVVKESEDGYCIEDEYMPEYRQKMGEILSQEQDITIRKVKVSDLGDIAISEADMDALVWMLED